MSDFRTDIPSSSSVESDLFPRQGQECTEGMAIRVTHLILFHLVIQVREGKNKPYGPIPVAWVPPPGMHCDQNHWTNPRMLTPHELLWILLVLREGRIRLTTC